MAIRDLLWACPACRTEESLRPAGRVEVCRACGARVRRGERATIVLQRPGGADEAREAGEWVDLIGDAVASGDTATAEVVLRDAERATPVRADGELLGFAERFGPRIHGTLSLDAESITFESADRTGRRVWTVLDLTAVQPASRSLQLKFQGESVVTLQFAHASVRLWEARIQHRLRDAWRAAGRGEITEFQPQVTAR